MFLPTHPVVKGCRFGCDPRDIRKMCTECRTRMDAGETLKTVYSPTKVVELPLNATEDRVSGTLDLESVLQSGTKYFEPGILAAANGNILYIDEINLLDDGIVDLLLDSAAMGTNYVEREGISFVHPANFILVGTMNPEEGELRPQLLDRFGLSVDVGDEVSLKTREEIIRQRLRYDSDPIGFVDSCVPELEDLTRRISEARSVLQTIEIDDFAISTAARISAKFRMEGHRSDLALIRSARANTALDGRDAISAEDFMKTAPMVLSHRLKKKAFEKATVDLTEVRKCISKTRSASDNQWTITCSPYRHSSCQNVCPR